MDSITGSHLFNVPTHHGHLVHCMDEDCMEGHDRTTGRSHTTRHQGADKSSEIDRLISVGQDVKHKNNDQDKGQGTRTNSSISGH